MSRGQHAQANKHGKHTTRGERWLSKLGVRPRTIGLRRLARELGAAYRGKGGTPMAQIGDVIDQDDKKVRVTAVDDDGNVTATEPVEPEQAP